MDDESIKEFFEKNELSSDDLEIIVGGRADAKHHNLIDAVIYEAKQQGKTKEGMIDAYREGWNILHTMFSTSGSPEDLENILKYIDEHW